MNVYRVIAETDKDRASIVVTGKNVTEAIRLGQQYIPVRHDVRDSVQWSAEFISAQGSDWQGWDVEGF